jgi:hypothetical protein
MKDTQLIYVDKDKNIVEEIKFGAEPDFLKYDFNRLYFVDTNELLILEKFNISIDYFKYTYKLNDENCSAILQIVSANIEEIKQNIINNINTHFIFLKTGSQSATYYKFDTHIDELIEFWKKIDATKQQLINNIINVNSISDLEKIDFNWPTYSLM